MTRPLTGMTGSLLHFLVKAGGPLVTDMRVSGRAFVKLPNGDRHYAPGLFLAPTVRALAGRRFITVRWRPGKRPCWASMRLTAKGRRMHAAMLAADAAALLNGERRWPRWA